MTAPSNLLIPAKRWLIGPLLQSKASPGGPQVNLIKVLNKLAYLYQLLVVPSRSFSSKRNRNFAIQDFLRIVPKEKPESGIVERLLNGLCDGGRRLSEEFIQFAVLKMDKKDTRAGAVSDAGEGRLE